jgi:pimeloyl-ACP methyl ester carboxylesterase
MPTPSRLLVDDVRGASRLAVDASTGVVDIVERMHRTIQRLPGPLGERVEEATRGITGFVYRSIRGTMSLVGRGLDLSLAPLAAALPDAESTPARDVVVAIVNGIYGDHLARSGNPLALRMTLRHEDAPAPTGKLLVLVHGLCMCDRQWHHEGYSHGAALADEFGYSPLYLRYNSGLPIAENGERFAELLETTVGNWPQPVEELVIIGHSMGGLVARSACHLADQRGHAWRRHLRRLVFLGTPHHGSPLERGGHRLDYLLDLSPYSAPFTRLGKSRSAGIQDLRHGTITHRVHETVPLPSGVACYAAAATLAARRSRVADRLLGDGLVPLDSALGRHTDRARALRIPRARQWIGHEMRHLEWLHRPEVYAQLRAWLGESA